MEQIARDPRADFLAVYNRSIGRNGKAALLYWLENDTDFFTAPASSKHHLAQPGGLGGRDHLQQLHGRRAGGPGTLGVCGERMGRRVDPAERFRIQADAEKRARESRWSAPGRARVVHPVHGTVVVPHSSNLTAIQNAAEVWRCDWTEITDAQVWVAEPGDVPAKMPYII